LPNHAGVSRVGVELRGLDLARRAPGRLGVLARLDPPTIPSEARRCLTACAVRPQLHPRGEEPHGDRVVFLHRGGLPGLFGYAQI
jgi:hypothetical protein